VAPRPPPVEWTLTAAPADQGAEPGAAATVVVGVVEDGLAGATAGAAVAVVVGVVGDAVAVEVAVAAAVEEAAAGRGGAEVEGDRAGTDCGWSAAGTDPPAGSTESRVFMSSTR
jgi:hypothetical protein